MAEVYDKVPGFQAGKYKTILDTDTRFRGRNDRSLERFIAVHEDVQRKVIVEGGKIQERATFRLTAAQSRHVFRLREELAEAIKGGDPDEIWKADQALRYYYANRTQVVAARSDIDFYISLYREDGREFFVEVDGDGDRGLEVLKDSLTH